MPTARNLKPLFAVPFHGSHVLERPERRAIAQSLFLTDGKSLQAHLQALHSGNGRMTFAVPRHHPSRRPLSRQMWIAALHPELLFHFPNSSTTLHLPRPEQHPTSKIPFINKKETKLLPFTMQVCPSYASHKACRTNSALPAGACPCLPGPTRPKRGSSGRTSPGEAGRLFREMRTIWMMCTHKL